MCTACLNKLGHWDQNIVTELWLCCSAKFIEAKANTCKCVRPLKALNQGSPAPGLAGCKGTLMNGWVLS